MKTAIILGVTLLGMQLGSSRGYAGPLAVDFAGNYGSQNRNASYTPTFATGDFDFDGADDDRAATIGWNTLFSPSNVWTTPTGKTSRLYFGAQIANLNSETNPAFGIVRINSNNVLQVTNAAGTASQRLSAAFFVRKSDFLVDSTTSSLGFLSSTGSLSFSLPSIIGSSSARFLVQNGTSWYVSDSSLTAAGSLGAAVNPHTTLWYSFDPGTNQFFDEASPGQGVLGSTLTDIQAFGVYAQFAAYNGAAMNAVRLDVGGLSAEFAPVPVPEVGTIGLASVAFVGLIFLQRRKRRENQLEA